MILLVLVLLLFFLLIQITAQVNDPNLLSFYLFSYSYHQKYRLQGHKDFAKEIGLTSKLLHSSHIAARLNGYLVGVGGIEQFLKEADYLGLSEGQKDYVRTYIEKHEGGGLYC